MKKQFLSLILLLALAVFAQAQEKKLPPPDERAKKQTEWMKTNLGLSDDQATQAQAVNLKYANKVQELQSSTAGRRQKLQTLKADETAKDAELQKIFTPDQYKKYEVKKDELKKEAKQQFKARRNG